MSAFTDLLADPNALKFYLMELSPYDPDAAAVVNRYVSDHGFTTEPSDSPANTFYSPRIQSAISVERSLLSSDRLRGQITSNFGTARLLAGDVGDNVTLDEWARYNWDGRQIKVLMGGEGFAYGDYGTIGTFTAEGADLSSTVLTLKLRDALRDLDLPIQVEKFQGTGGLEGDSEMEGVLKPRLLGKVRHFEPVYIGAVDLGDGNLETFAYNDGAANGVVDVYSNGNTLNEVTSGAPGSGEWKDYPADGVFQLGGSTLGTVITCHAEGAKNGSGTYVSSFADITEYVVTDLTDITLKSGTVSAMNTANSAALGYWIPEGGNALRVLSALANSVGAYFYVDRFGEMVLGRVEAPGTPVETFDEVDILDIKRRTTALPTKGVRVLYRRNWRTLSRDQIAGAVTGTFKTFLQRDWRTKDTGEDSAVATAHLLAEDEEFETYIDDETAAGNEATRLQGVFGEDREVFEVLVQTQPFARDLGETVTIKTDRTQRFNLGSGKDFVIIGLKESAASNRVKMTLWG